MIPCKWGCGHEAEDGKAAVLHRAACPRLRRLDNDLELKVRAGKRTIEEAEAEQAKRPKLRL